jgi:arylsulfatase A-like enzyme/Tfp pilus assembly protein PilF
MKGRAALVAFLVTASALACAQKPAARSAASRSAAARPNVLFITIDTLRADHVGCYGYRDIKTPAIDGLCRDGIVFDHAIAQVPLTWPSHVAMLTGTYPFWNGVQDFTGQPLRPGVATLSEAMKRRGYATGAVVSSFVLDRSFGMARGFDSYYDAFTGKAFLEKDLGLVDRRAGESVDHALAWLKTKRGGRPFFFWLHLYDPHSPYNAPEPFRSEYRDRPYDGEVAYADSHLARVFTWLKQAGLYDSTLIVLTSDHGESLGDHGEREHGYFIYASTIHVPLVVKPPRAKRLKPRREPTAVETIAIPATVLGLLGIRDPLEQQLQAPSLLAEDEASLAYSQTLYPYSSFGWSPLHSLESAQYKYIEAPEPELYDLRNDPAEQKNVIAAQPAVAAVMKQKLAERQQKFALPANQANDAALDPEAAAKLRALGYMAYKAPVAEDGAASLPDPKRKLGEFNAILRATDLLQLGRFEEAATLLDSVREQDPKMYLIPFLLAEAAIRRGDMAQATADFRKTLALNPGFDQAMLGLARALHAQTQDDEALEWLKKALELNPRNYRAWYQIAWIETAQRRDAGAAAAFEKVLEIQPNFGLAYRDLGMLRIRQQDYPNAARLLGRAAELGVEEAPLYNFLGIAQGQTGAERAALESYRHAVKLDPALAEARLNFGIALYKAGQRAAAKPEFQEACRLKAEFCRYTPAELR